MDYIQLENHCPDKRISNHVLNLYAIVMQLVFSKIQNYINNLELLFHMGSWKNLHFAVWR